MDTMQPIDPAGTNPVCPTGGEALSGVAIALRDALRGRALDRAGPTLDKVVVAFTGPPQADRWPQLVMWSAPLLHVVTNIAERCRLPVGELRARRLPRGTMVGEGGHARHLVTEDVCVMNGWGDGSRVLAVVVEGLNFDQLQDGLAVLAWLTEEQEATV